MGCREFERNNLQNFKGPEVARVGMLKVRIDRRITFNQYKGINPVLRIVKNIFSALGKITKSFTKRLSQIKCHFPVNNLNYMT